MAQLSYVIFHGGNPIAFVPRLSGPITDQGMQKVLDRVIKYAERRTGTHLRYVSCLTSPSELQKETKRLGTIADWVDRVGRMYLLNTFRSHSLAQEQLHDQGWFRGDRDS